MAATKRKKSGFPWLELYKTHPELTLEILHHCRLSVLAYERPCQCVWKKNERPLEMQTPLNDRFEYLLDKITTLTIERPRGPTDRPTAWPIMGHGPGDKLTVIYRQVLDQNPSQKPSALDYYAEQATEQGWTLDKNAVYDAVKVEQRWHNVSKIRLLPNSKSGWPAGRAFNVELVLEGIVNERQDLEDVFDRLANLDLERETSLTRGPLFLSRSQENDVVSWTQTVFCPYSLYFGWGGHETTYVAFEQKLTRELKLQHTIVDGGQDGLINQFSV